MRDSVSLGYPNTEKRVENTTSSGVIFDVFDVFGKPMKHCLECLIYLLRQKLRSKQRSKIGRIHANYNETGYPNLLHGYDFLCFNLMKH